MSEGEGTGTCTLSEVWSSILDAARIPHEVYTEGLDRAPWDRRSYVVAPDWILPIAARIRLGEPPFYRIHGTDVLRLLHRDPEVRQEYLAVFHLGGDEAVLRFLRSKVSP